MNDKFIHYEYEGKNLKVPVEQQKEFESKVPSAKMMLTYNNKNYKVPLSELSTFSEKVGADNLTYSVFDENKEYAPNLSTQKYGFTESIDTETEKPSTKSKLENFAVSANDSLMRAQLGGAKTYSDKKMEEVTAPAPTVNVEKANAVIASHAKNKSRVDEYISKIDEEYKAMSETKPDKTFWQKFGESVAKAGAERRLGATSYTIEQKKEDIKKGQNYIDAKIAKNIIGKTEDKVNQYSDPAKTFVGGAAQGLIDTVFDIDTWDSTVGAEQAARVYAITKKLDKGTSLTDGERMIVDALVDDLASDIYLASGFGRGYKAGTVTGESLPFMLETMLNPASGLGKSITKKFGKKILERVGKKLGTTMAKAALAGTRVATDIAGAAIMSATTSQARVAEDALNRLSGQVDFTIGKDGLLKFNGFREGEDSAFKAYAKAFGANTIEHFSEMVGEYFSPIGKEVGKWSKNTAIKLADKVGLKKISNLLENMTPNGFGSALGEFMEGTQWHGTIGEFAEEMVSGALNALIVGDQTMKKYDKNGNINQNYLFDKDNLIDTFLGVALLGGVMSTAKTLSYTTPETQYNRAIASARKGLNGVLSDEEINQLEAFANNPLGVDSANLRPLFENRSEEFKKAVGKYLDAVMKKQGYEIARNANLSGTQHGMEEMRNAWNLGQNMTEADLYDINEAEENARQALIGTGMFDVPEGADSSFLPEHVLDFGSYDLFRLSERQDWAFTTAQREAIKNLAIIRNAKEGLNNRLETYTNIAIQSHDAISNEAAENGIITVGVYNDRIVYIRGGVNISNGQIVAPSNVSGATPVEIVDSVTGEVSTVNANEINDVVRGDVVGYNEFTAEQITSSYQKRWEEWRNKKSAKSKLAEIEQFVGQKVFINTGNGMTEVEVQQILPNGEVLIKGKKGDLGGQSIITMSAPSFYDSIHRDDTGNPVITEAGPEEAEQPVEETPQAEANPEADYRGEEVTILINGVPTAVVVTAQDGTSDTITYEYVDENGNTRTGSSTIGAFQQSIQQSPEAVPAEETPVAEEAPVAEEPAPAEPTEEPAPVEGAPLTPEAINWDELFDRDPEAYFNELQNQFGEETIDILNEEIEAAHEELDSLGKAKTRSQNERLENRAKKAKLQARINTLGGMVARLTAAPEPEVVPDTPVTPADETPAPEVPVAETPEVPAVDTPTAPETLEVPVAETPETPVAETPEVTPEPEPEPVAETPVDEPAPVQQTPVAPNPVDNLVDAALKEEEKLRDKLGRTDLNRNEKRDWAYKYGKKIADMFATREEYGAYEAVAKSLGAYDEDFERGVNDSFANRPQNTGIPHGNSVTLEPEPNGENNGEQPATNEPTTEGRGSDTTGGRTDDGGSEETGEGDQTSKSTRSGKGKKGKEKVVEKYPARNGNATGKILVETFGFDSVTIPNKNKEVLNTIYDFMMEMSKALGISPKTIGQGGWIGVANLNAKKRAFALHEVKYNTITREVKEVKLKFKYARLSSIAHEWWHSLDRALSYFETGRFAPMATDIDQTSFTGRKETWEAVQAVMQAINDSGYTDRIDKLLAGQTRSEREYFLSNTEQAARAFDNYISDKFAAAGITIENYDNHVDESNPTPEEMAVISPAFDNLFNVLQEKEGKKAGTSVLYHIGEQLDNNSEAKKLATEAILRMLKEAGIDVEQVSDEQVEEMLRIRAELTGNPFELMTVFHGSAAMFEAFDHSHIGEGEGAQAHGWGTYVAVNKKTSERYATFLKGGKRVFMNGVDVTEKSKYTGESSPLQRVCSLIKMYGERLPEYILLDNDYLEEQKKYYEKQGITELVDEYNSYIKLNNDALELYSSNSWRVEDSKANLYTVEIPEDDGSNYLNEDGKMSEDELSRLEDACNKEGVDFLEVLTPEINDNRGDGEIIYSNLSRMLGSDKAASEFLSRAGFVGIKYTGYRDGECFVIFKESDAKITNRTELYQTPNGTVYGWTDGKKIYLTEAGINPNTPVHEYTHLWAKAMMQKNPKGWNSIKNLLKGTPVWDDVLNDSNYSNIHNDEDAVASEVLSRISGANNALKLEQMAQQMIDEAKGTMRKLEAHGLVQRIKDALNEFWKWVGVELFGIENFDSVEDITDRVLYDLINHTDLIGPNNDKISRKRRDGESAMEFTESIVSECKKKYNTLCETDVYKVDSTLAARFGYTLEELNEKDGIYEHTDVSDLIAIFAHERNNDGLLIENVFFHENIHYLSARDNRFLEFGQWLFDNANLHPVLESRKDIVVSDYTPDMYSTEMLSYAISYFMSTGSSDAFSAMLSYEHQDLLKEIENRIGYDRAAEESVRRADENIQFTSWSKDSSVSEGESYERGSSIEEGTEYASQIAIEADYNTGIDPTEVARESARETYGRVVNKGWQEFQRQFQDAYQPVRVAIDAIQQETGNIPIEDYENYLLIQNQMSSRSRVEIDSFSRRYYSPIIEQINSIIDKIITSTGLDPKNKEHRASVYNEVKRYLIAKHGLERNEYYQSHNTRKLTPYEQKKENDNAKKEYDDKVDAINNDSSLSDLEKQLMLRDALDEYNAALLEIKTREVPDLRDYSGLTALFGMTPKMFREAEEEARKLVNEFEVRLGRVNDADGEIISQSADIEALWKRIKSATDKTLRHSYESGLLSRKQYDDISKMFEFYIPLRGFDETTAEDVYSYARFEGNRFNPAVQTAKGRTSIADDPIAIIMNMAESEIAQGNKNRAKQALYNYLLNRIGNNNQQNSLMQVEEVWYMKTIDATGNEVYVIATPNYEGGETYEDFANRMAALEAKDEAYKSKRGNKVDVGMRFQKQMNRNAHYVYLKVNGVEKAIYINGDPKAADAINGTYKQKPLPKATVKIAGKEVTVDIAAIQRNISSTFTNYSLEFTLRNYFRDMLYSAINIGVRESDPAYRKKFRQNWLHNNGGTMLRMLKAYRAGEYDGKDLNEDEAAFVEFMENGGQTGYTLINSVEAHKSELENAIKRMQNGIEKGGLKDNAIFRATLGGIELLNEASELVTRFAAYKTSRDMGRGIHKSISDAKEVTVNFNTKGAQDGTGLWGRMAQYLGWSKYFFNASVQGVQNIKAMADANRLKFCTTVGCVAATGFLTPVIIGAIASLIGGDEDDDIYWNIPEYDRQNNLCIPVGGGMYAKLTLPIGFREVYAIGDMLAAMMFDKRFDRDSEQVGIDIANKFAAALLPINPLEGSVNGLSVWASIGTVVAPSSAQFIIQNMTNTDWKGAPIQKEYTYNEDDPQWMKAYESNPLWMKSTARWMNENLGVGDFKGVDISPEKFDNTLSNLFGGVYSIVKKLGRGIETTWNSIVEKEPVWDIVSGAISSLPVSGVVTGSGIKTDDMFITDAYYDMKSYYDERLSYIKRRAEKFGYDLDDVFLKQKGAHHPKMQEIYSNETFDFMQEWYKGNEELDKLNNEIKKIKKKIAEKEKPSQSLIEKLARAEAKFEAERREFVNDMLELD